MAEEKAAPGFDPVGDLAGAIAHLTDLKGHGHGSVWSHNPFQHFMDELGEYGVSRGGFLTFLFICELVAAAALMPQFFVLAFSWLFLGLPLGLPAILIVFQWKVWVWYVRALFIGSRKNVLLELKFPRDIVKSPRAMETVLAAFWVVTGQTTFIDRYWDGKMSPWYSLEMASFGGEVHFYVWCWQEYRSLIESQIYAQYPEVEITEAEDYSTKFVYDPAEWDIFGNDHLFPQGPGGTLAFGREVPRSGVYPIKSYIDFELDKDPKEEYKVDQFAQVVERLSGLDGSEQAWVQIIFRASPHHQKEFYDWSKEEVELLRVESATFAKGTYESLSPQQQMTARPRATWRQTQMIQTIERHAEKRLFDVGIRICYAAKYDDYSAQNRNSIRWIFVPYASAYLNYLRPRRWHGPFDYPWQDFHGVRWILTSRRFLDAWRRRSYFYAPWITTYMVMSTESIASLWHPPSRAIESPQLHRIPATKAPPPPNLPK